MLVIPCHDRSGAPHHIALEVDRPFGDDLNLLSGAALPSFLLGVQTYHMTGPRRRLFQAIRRMDLFFWLVHAVLFDGLHWYVLLITGRRSSWPQSKDNDLGPLFTKPWRFPRQLCIHQSDADRERRGITRLAQHAYRAKQSLFSGTPLFYQVVVCI